MPSEEQTYREWLQTALERIEKQTTTTNGRVTKLERWQAYVLGFCGAVSLFLIPVFFMLIEQFI